MASGSAQATPRHPLKPERGGPGLRVGHIQTYRFCDLLSEALIYLMIVFGPWAFGTTQTWSIWTMNVAGYTLGLLLAVKIFIRRFTPYRPPRWDSHSGSQPSTLNSQLAVLTLVLLSYTLISALNARATWSPEAGNFLSRPFISWLPSSLDGAATWFAFWTYLGLAASFWSIRDWLLGQTPVEARGAGDGGRSVERGAWSVERGAKREQGIEDGANSEHSALRTPHSALEGSQLSTLNSQLSFPLPSRLRRLLWFLALNGAILGLEGIVQRLANCPKLLFVVLPHIHQTAESQFGPYAYRSNAAQYFNLLWPVCLGFWWILNRSAAPRETRHHLLLFCAGIMAACPVISSTRAGAGVMVAMLVVAVLILLVMELRTGRRHRRDRRAQFKTLQPFLFFALGALILGLGLGAKSLLPRLDQLGESYEDREVLCDIARRISDQYPLFGTGPGTYGSVSASLYPLSQESLWVQVHNDFLETLVTFGWVGSMLIYLALACVLVRWFMRGGIHGGRRFVLLIWLALAGCFAQARFDFPFQIHSILFLFLLLCAILSILTRRAERS